MCSAKAIFDTAKRHFPERYFTIIGVTGMAIF